ncbi:hypothetical protein BLNAU_13850 [Blattamonas nauphoetae]|uniref:Uncharacterized protein n=1 Tax=Blattamonas nauphoetae TaxID=2049346 RepID=A0ABQ9XK80_9EUKA|nr:hypothetical protein BLNAU_13850 [Blattamonas nauphoetae]
MMDKASECGKHVSECDTLCLMKFGGHKNQTFSSFYSAAVQNATNTTSRDNTTSNTTHSSPIDAHFADRVRETEASLETCLGTCTNTIMSCQVSLDFFCTQKCVDVKENSQKSNTNQSIAVNRPLQSRDRNEDTPITEDDEDSVGSNWMSKCRLHNMPCKDEFVKPSISRQSDAKMRSPANNRTKEGKEGDTEGLAAKTGRLNDFETVRKNAKERVRMGIDGLKATEEKYNQEGERLKQQGEELKKKAESMKQQRKDLEHTSCEFRQRTETIKNEAERHAANLKKERDEMWKTGKEEIEHAHEEEKEAISAAEAKAKETKKKMVARFNYLKKEEESMLSAAKDKLAALGMKMRAAQLDRSPEQEKRRKNGSAGEAPQGRAQAVAPEENGRGQTRAASDQTEHRAGTSLAAGRGEGAAATREERVRIEGG